MMSLPTQDPTQRGGNVFNQDQFVRDHINALLAEAEEERFVREQHAQPVDAPAGFGRRGVRGAFGRALIALGSAIASTSIEERGARRDIGHVA
jgi:hypothetical protein